jgi:hypothetical protein
VPGVQRDGNGNIVSGPNADPGALAKQQMADFVNNTKSFGLQGDFTAATGQHYATGGGGRAASSSGAADAGDGGIDESLLARMNGMMPSGGAGYAPQAAIPGVAPIDTSGAEAAAFARAKDKVGQVSQGAITSLRSAAGATGQLGSGAAMRQTGNVINAGQGELGQVARDQAIEGARSAGDTSKFNYSGAVTQRGQDIGAATANRGLDIEAANSRVNQMQGLMALLRASRRPSTAVSY